MNQTYGESVVSSDYQKVQAKVEVWFSNEHPRTNLEVSIEYLMEDIVILATEKNTPNNGKNEETQ